MFSLLIFLFYQTGARGPALITVPDDVTANLGDKGTVYKTTLKLTPFKCLYTLLECMGHLMETE